MDHRLGEIFQSRALCERAISLQSNPNHAIRATYQYFRSRLHRFVSCASLLPLKSRQHFYFCAQISDGLPSGGSAASAFTLGFRQCLGTLWIPVLDATILTSRHGAELSHSLQL